MEVDEGAIDGIARRFVADNEPGLAIGIAVDGNTEYRKAFGLASLDLPLPLSSSMRMRVGSITKQFTCLAWLLLGEKGGVALGDEIGTFIPELPREVRGATVVDLMTHTSGIRDVIDLSWYLNGTGQFVSASALLEIYRRGDVRNAPPGAHWRYNNGAYLLLSLAIERIVDQPFEDFLEERILKPLGMVNSLLRRRDTDFVANSSSLHMVDAGGAYARSTLGNEMLGEGGLVSTVDDMLLWLCHMDNPQIGSPASWHQMKRARRLSNGFDTGYGLGLILGAYRGVSTIGHAGSVFGGNAQALKVPEHRLDLVVISNRHDVSSVEVGNAILDSCLAAAISDERPGHGTPIDAVYRSTKTGRVVQLRAREGRQLVAVDGLELVFEPAADGAFRPSAKSSFIRQALRFEGDGTPPPAILFEDFGTVEHMTRLTASHGKPVSATFRSQVLQAELRVQSSLDGHELHASGPAGFARYRLSALSKTVFRADSIPGSRWSAICDFETDGTLFFSTPRNPRVPFQRAT